jgi:glycogen synthase
VFGGDNPAAQADEFVKTTARALRIRSTDRVGWQTICRAAAARRFDWDSSAKITIQTLYSDGNGS